MERKALKRRCMLFIALFCTCLAIGFGADTQPGINGDQLPLNYVPNGKTMYKDYCASCHGLGAKGDGPMAMLLKVPPADLTTLAKRHGGKFPYEYVSGVLEFGPGPTPLHGAADMPAWGPLFQYMDRYNERVVQQRIKNLSDYLASMQEK